MTLSRTRPAQQCPQLKINNHLEVGLELDLEIVLMGRNFQES